MHRPRLAALTAAGTFLFASAIPVRAITLREFRKYSREDQSVFISGAISMMAYSFAANGQVTVGRCVRQWYFGNNPSEKTEGPSQVAAELLVAERSDPDKYQVEGVLLGLADKVCKVPAVQ